MATIFDHYNDSVAVAIGDKPAKAEKAKTAELPPGTLSKGGPSEEEKRKRIEDRDKFLKARGYNKGGSIDGCAQRGKTRARR